MFTKLSLGCMYKHMNCKSILCKKIASFFKKLTCKTGQFLPKTANRLSSDPFLCAKIVKNGQCCRNFDSASNDVIP